MRHLHVWDWDDQGTRQELLRMAADHFTLPATFETLHRRKDGSVYEVEVSSIGAELGGIKYVYCVSRDITRRKATEAALRESRRLEGIGILAGGMAHEFNNLLTVINGYSGILANSFDIHDPMREQVEAIRGAGERAAGLTRQLLTYGRKQIIRRRVLDLNLVVERTRRAWMPLLHLWGQGYVEPVVAPPEPRHIVAQQLLALCLQEHRIGSQLWAQEWNGLA